MPQQTKIFRVFVSSTFTDMKEERRVLQKEVFPKLEKYCEENGAKFQAVDLRWGVNEESQLNQKTLDICLKEIARCQKVSPKPNFIILLGDKYGWQPIPPKIPATDMQKILDVISLDQKKLLNQWYRLDENAVPAEYVLQPRGEEFKEYKTQWEPIETNIRNILRNAVEKISLLPEQKEKYFASATRQEILAGALNPPKGIEKPEEHVLAFIRHIESLPNDKTAVGFIDLMDGRPDPYCAKQLGRLKVDLKEKLKNHVVPYEAQWQDGNSAINDPNGFAEKALNFLKGVIEGQLKDIISVDEIEHEIRLHKEFKDGLTSYFVGRASTLQEIKEYLSDSSEQKVLSLIRAGIGKVEHHGSSGKTKCRRKSIGVDTLSVYWYNLPIVEYTIAFIEYLRPDCQRIWCNVGISCRRRKREIIIRVARTLRNIQKVSCLGNGRETDSGLLGCSRPIVGF